MTRHGGAWTVALAAAALLAARPSVAKKEKILCPPARYVVAGGTPAAPALSFLDVADPADIAVAGVCPPAAGKRKATRRGTRLRAGWDAGVCSGLSGKVRLKAKTDATCTTLHGKLKAKKYKRKIEATRSACGDGVLDPEEICPLLEGPDDGPALAAVVGLDAPTPIPQEANTTDATGRPLVRTRIEMVFDEEATVAEVNAVIDGVGGRIVSMVAGVPSVVLDLPDPGSVEALEALASQLGAEPVVEEVFLAYEPDADSLPPNYAAPLAPGPASRLDHHLATRLPAAWNARDAIRGLATIAILDYFGDGPPDAAIDAALSPDDFAVLAPDSHGYHVLGIVAAAFGGDGSGRGQATGAFPTTASVRAIDIQDPSTDYRTEQNRVLQRLRDEGNVHGVLNTSLGAHCGTPLGDILRGGSWWARKIRMAGLEDRVLHLTSAGNVKGACPLAVAAEENSEYTASALLPLQTPSGDPLPNLENVLAVENAVNGPGPDFAPRCLAPGSKSPGHLAAIGTDVWSITGGTSGAGNKTGTSMATPQAAGLAAYLWALDPDMTVQDLRGLLLATARPAAGNAGQAGCAGLDPAPVIDAYAAVLALDEAVLPTPATAPMRLAILDVDDDGDFDRDDLEFFLVTYVQNYVDGSNHGPPHEPADRTWGRLDLNGDGFEGGSNRAPLDLDLAGSTRYGAAQLGSVSQDEDGIMVSFDETAVTDLEALCYWTYSGLWGGTEAERQHMMDPALCSPVVMTVTFPATIAPGIPETLHVLVEELDATGTRQPLPGVYVETDAMGGTVAPPTGTTDAQGELTAQATLAPGSGTISIVVRARSAPGDRVLAQRTVGASVFDLCEVYLGVGANPSQSDPAGPLNDTSVDGPVTVTGSARPGMAHLEVDYDIADAPWSYAGGGEAIWEDWLLIEPADPAFVGFVGKATYRLHITYESQVDNRTIPERSQGWIQVDTSTYPVEFRRRNFGGTQGPEEADLDVTQPFAFGQPSGSGRWRTRLSSFTGFGGERIDAAVHGAITVEFVDIVDVRDADGNALAWTSWRSLCTGAGSGTTTTSTSSSTSSTTTTSTSTSSSSQPSTTSPTTVTTTSTSLTTTTLFVSPVVPYRAYAASGPDGPAVTLADAFGMQSVDLGAVDLYLPPVTIDGEPPPDPDTPQTCYAHPGATFVGCLDVTNRFGDQPVRLGDAIDVCVPSLFPAIAVDAFTCYAAVGADVGATLATEDAFQQQAVTVGAPTLLCLPTTIDGSTLVFPERLLVCYATEPTGAAGGSVMVENDLHAGPVQVDVGTPVGLCLPTLAQPVSTCALCGDGNLDPDEECDDGNVLAGDGCSPVCRDEVP